MRPGTAAPSLSPNSIHARVAAARERLREADLSPQEAEAGARLLAQHVLGWDAARYLTDGDRPEPVGFAAGYDALVTRRAAREPVAYITGRQEFWNLDFEVSPAVLIPRPSTELIVEAAIEVSGDRGAPIDMADAFTGCGCVAVVLAKEFRPRARRHGHLGACARGGGAQRGAHRVATAWLTRTDVLEEERGPSI